MIIDGKLTASTVVVEVQVIFAEPRRKGVSQIHPAAVTVLRFTGNYVCHRSRPCISGRREVVILYPQYLVGRQHFQFVVGSSHAVYQYQKRLTVQGLQRLALCVDCELGQCLQ